MTTKFVDLNGHTARFDLPKTPTAYARLSVMTTAQYNDATGDLIEPGRTVELYITKPQAQALAIALQGEGEWPN